MFKINKKLIYRQWRKAGHTVAHARAAIRFAYVIGHRPHNGRWVPVLSTDLGDEYKTRT